MSKSNIEKQRISNTKKYILNETHFDESFLKLDMKIFHYSKKYGYSKNK